MRDMVGATGCAEPKEPHFAVRKPPSRSFECSAPALAARLALLGVKPRLKWDVLPSQGPALADEAMPCVQRVFVCLMHNLTPPGSLRSTTFLLPLVSSHCTQALSALLSPCRPRTAFRRT